MPDRLVRGRPVTLLQPGRAGAVLIVVARPGDRVEVSPRLAIDRAGSAARAWTPVPAPGGIAAVPVADVAAGLASAVRVLRDGEVVPRSGFPLPADDPPAAAPVVLPALRRAAQPLDLPAASLRPRALWAADLTRTGGLGTVAVVVVTVPGDAGLVTTHGRVGPAGTGREIPCGTTPLPVVTPDGTTAVRTLDAAGRPLDVATVPPAEDFGDHGDG